ncbi:type II RES/Xre toxin-antitoxin system antitoxin [Pseudomonas sp. X10]
MIESTSKPRGKKPEDSAERVRRGADGRFVAIAGGRASSEPARATVGKKGADSSGVFWRFSKVHGAMTESERLVQIKQGLPAGLYQEVRAVFRLPEKQLAELFNASISTLERRVRDNKPLDPVASERLDRIAAISHQALEVFESEEEATAWMSRSNDALGGAAPVMLCETEIGARQVRRVLTALEWGGVV